MNLIGMHAKAHFGGSVSFMLDYYRKGGVGVLEEIEPDDIEAYQEKEAPLTEREEEWVESAKEAYRKIQELYETKAPSAESFADLVLSEEEEPDLEAVLVHKEILLPRLIDLLNDDSFEDPLFPGYGLAPGRAAKALATIGGKKAVIALFTRLIHGESGSLQERILSALSSLQPYDFLLGVLQSRPIGIENETAAMVLSGLEYDEEVARTVRAELGRLQKEGAKAEIVKQYLTLYLPN